MRSRSLSLRSGPSCPTFPYKQPAEAPEDAPAAEPGSTAPPLQPFYLKSQVSRYLDNLFAGLYRAAAHNGVAIVEHQRLPRRRTSNRFIEANH